MPLKSPTRPRQLLPRDVDGPIRRIATAPRFAGLANYHALSAYLEALDDLGLTDPTGQVKAGLDRHDELVAAGQPDAPGNVSAGNLAATVAETVDLDGIPLTFGTPPEDNKARRRAILDAARLTLQHTAQAVHDYGDAHVALVAPILDKALKTAQNPKASRGALLDAEDRWEAARDLLDRLRAFGAVAKLASTPHNEIYLFADVAAVHDWRIANAPDVRTTWARDQDRGRTITHTPISAPRVPLATAAAHATAWDYKVRTATEALADARTDTEPAPWTGPA